MNKRGFFIRLMAILAMGSPCFGSATELQFSGYLSQSVIYADNNPFYDDDTGINFNLRELGLNLAWEPNDHLRIAGQLLSRRAGDLDDGNPRIDFLLMDYQYLRSETLSAGIRLGRIKNPYGIYNLTRDVPHGRPGVFVQQSVYFESLREAVISTDGGGLYWHLSGPMGGLFVDIYAGGTHFSNEAPEYLLFQFDAPGEIDKAEGVGFRLMVEPANPSGLTAAISLAPLKTAYGSYPLLSLQQLSLAQSMLLNDPTLYPYFTTALDVDALLSLYSLQYARESWILTAEFLETEIEISDLEILYLPWVGRTSKLQAYYLQLEWLVSQKVSSYIRYDQMIYNTADRDGKDYARLTGANANTQFNKAVTIGARWYIMPDLSVTGEYSIHNGAAFINGQSEINYDALKEDWDMFVLQFAYHF